MAQTLRTLLLATCAILSFFVILLWIKSYIRSDTICWDRNDSVDAQGWRTQWAVQSRRGAMVIGRFFYSPAASSWAAGPMRSDAQGTAIYRARAMPLDWIGPEPTAWGRLGFDYRHTYSKPLARSELTIVSLPHAAIAVPLVVWPALCYRRWRRLRKRERLGLCANCGYDLQGITSERCPECGTSTGALA